ncbi:hypothetical protein BH10CYA1_BH10CYA1_37850 [soil metagenome]
MTTNNRKRSLRKSSASRRLELTVYQDGQAVIRESRELPLVKGKNSVQLDGLPTAFVENSLVVLGAQGPGEFNIGSSSYEPANMSGSSILQKAIGSKVTLIEQSQQGPVRSTGILKFVLGNQVVLEQDGAIVVVPLTPKFELGDGIPDGLANTPSLVFEPSVSEAGKYQVRFLYEADNINWAARYNAFFDQKTNTLTRFECVVDITNQSGLQIDEGVFKLFTGTNYGTGRRSFPKGSMRAAAAPMAMSARGGAGLESVMADDASVESVGEQKLFVLPDSLSIGATATKNCNLFLAQGVPVQVELYLPANYYGYNGLVVGEDDGTKLPVSVRLRVKNDDASNLGKDMPAGEVAFFVFDSSGAEQKVDSASVDARAKGEPFKLELRKPSSDVKATRRLTFVHQDQPDLEPEVEVTPEGGLPDTDDSEGGPQITLMMRPAVVAPPAPEKKIIKPLFREEERQVTIFNYKGEDVVVLVSETFPEKAEFIKRPDFADSNHSAGTIRVTVPANGKQSVSYRIKYRIN